jgi:protein phosphatase
LCSDGLSNKVSDPELTDTIHSSSGLSEACNRLIDMANERGGEDNITAIIARIEETDAIFSGMHMFGTDLKNDSGLRANSHWM